MTAFDKPFLFIDNPAGGVENIEDMHAAGFRGVFLNVVDYTVAEWEAKTIRSRCAALGMFCGAWGRTGHPPPKGTGFENAKLDKIIAAADRWQAPLIVNSEKELDGSGAVTTKWIALHVGTRDAAISMEAWPFASVDWTPVAHLPVLPQFFPVEWAVPKSQSAIKAEWHRVGVKCVYFTFGTYGGMKPFNFNLQAPYSLFTADAIEGGPAGYKNWSPTSTGFKGCVDTVPEPPPPPPPKPNTTATRNGMYALGKPWVDAYPDNELARITIATRALGKEFTDAEWKRIAPVIDSLMDLEHQ